MHVLLSQLILTEAFKRIYLIRCLITLVHSLSKLSLGSLHSSVILERGVLIKHADRLFTVLASPNLFIVPSPTPSE
jgi:hypothetical protein